MAIFIFIFSALWFFFFDEEEEENMFVLVINVPVNSLGPVGTVGSPNLVFSWESLTERLTITLCTYLMLH